MSCLITVHCTPSSHEDENNFCRRRVLVSKQWLLRVLRRVVLRGRKRRFLVLKLHGYCNADVRLIARSFNFAARSSSS
jgi:hypothetical protein